MAFQQTVYGVSGAGIPGESYNDSPSRGQPYLLNSASAAYNVFARAFTVSSQGVAQAGNPSGTAVFAGILVNPKGSALYGNITTPTLTLPNGVAAEINSMGTYFIVLPAAAAIGDTIIYDNTTGILETIAPGADLPTGKSPAYGFVDVATVSGAGLAIGTFTYVPAIPVSAGPVVTDTYVDPSGGTYTDPSGDDYTPAPSTSKSKSKGDK